MAKFEENKHIASMKAIDDLLKIDEFTHDVAMFFQFKVNVESLYERKKAGTANASDLKVLELLELHSERLLTLMNAIAKVPLIPLPKEASNDKAQTRPTKGKRSNRKRQR